MTAAVRRRVTAAWIGAVAAAAGAAELDPVRLPIAGEYRDRLTTAIDQYDAVIAREVDRLATLLVDRADAATDDPALQARLRGAERLLREGGTPPPSALARVERDAGQGRVNRAVQLLAIAYDAVAKDLRAAGDETGAAAVLESRTAILLATSLWIPVPRSDALESAADPADDAEPALPPYDVFRADRVLTNSLGMPFVLVPAGAVTDAASGRTIEVTRPFWMARMEVTQAQWREVMKSQPWRRMPYVQEGDSHAASWLSWNLAETFCRTLTERERAAGLIGPAVAYTLPSEAQWEYACRAGTTSRYSFGDDDALLGDHAWWGGAWNPVTATYTPGRGQGNATQESWPYPVGTREANPWGLHDMHGNVWEPCGDRFESVGSEAGPAARVLRGGSWPDPAWACESGFRGNTDPTKRVYNIGLRVVRTAVRDDVE